MQLWRDDQRGFSRSSHHHRLAGQRMSLEDLLPIDLSIQDALDPSSREQLATACQALDLPVPPEDGAPGGGSPERLARARAERQERLSEALALASPLVKSSGYDIQALTVSMRLSIEAGGLLGSEQALSVLGQVLNRGWSGLARVSAELPEREREKRQRKWGRYLDAVFEQLYLWLSREWERQPEALCTRLRQAAPTWQRLRSEIERGLASTGVRVARYDSVSQLLEQLCRASEAPTPAAPALAGGAVTPEPAPSGEPSASSEAGVEQVANAGSGLATEARALLQVSSHFWELQQRLAAFAELLERREYEKAGIVAADLRATLEHFDVARYFPGLFARYFECCAEHARHLAEHRPDEGALRSSALSWLYRTDLSRFLELRATPRVE